MDYKELRRLAEAATPGPWEHDEDGPIAQPKHGERTRRILSINAAGEQRTADSKYIAAASPSVVLALLEEIEALRKDAERYRWLRKGEPYNVYTTSATGKSAIYVSPRRELDYGHALDAAIDAQLDKQEKQ